MLKREESKKS